MEEKDVDDMAEKLRSIKSEVGDVLEVNNLNIGEVMSLLMSMLIEVSLDSGLSSIQLVHGISAGCMAWEELNSGNDDNDNEGMENLQWLN